MMALNEQGNYEPWVQPAYGTNAKDRRVSPPKGYRTREFNSRIRTTDIVFDVYSGWMTPGSWHSRNRCHARSEGRWTTWARRVNTNYAPARKGEA